MSKPSWFLPAIRFAPVLAIGLAWPGTGTRIADVRAMCCPIPCDDCWLSAEGQLNLVVMDRARGQVRLIPNISFRGLAEDFALVVPTPSLPEFGVVAPAIWAEARQLTLPIQSSRRSNEGLFGCEEPLSPDEGAPAGTGPDDGVVIHAERTVGAFQATVISSDDPEALVSWLRDHGFALASEDAARFAPYIERGWFFTAMKPDTTDPANEMPPGGWNANVNPVLITYAAPEFEVPLPIIGINRSDGMVAFFYVIDDHRMTLEGFATDYANRLSAIEYAAIARRYPNLAAFLAPGRFLTRLTRTFTAADPMERSILLARAASDEEFRRIGGRNASLPAELLVLGIGVAAVRRRFWRFRQWFRRFRRR